MIRWMVFAAILVNELIKSVPDYSARGDGWIKMDYFRPGARKYGPKKITPVRRNPGDVKPAKNRPLEPERPEIPDCMKEPGRRCIKW